MVLWLNVRGKLIILLVYWTHADSSNPTLCSVNITTNLTTVLKSDDGLLTRIKK